MGKYRPNCLERKKIPFDGGLWFAGDGGLKLDVVELNALDVLGFLHELRHLFLSYKSPTPLVVEKYTAEGSEALYFFIYLIYIAKFGIYEYIL